VKKDGYEFAYWYDVKSPTTKVEFIKDAVGGNEFRVKAKYNPLTYDLRLHIDGETTPRVLRNISNKLDFILPTDIEVEDKEFVNWSYKDA
ncbi:InlB B-repeat-containing protein, partial [Klebsiella pneumoniae]|uniref:InlB B-repeat-containing protein n=1 Tax=Klebsiella pneumoniae TaxID=573 RepID=UPI0025A101F0